MMLKDTFSLEKLYAFGKKLLQLLLITISVSCHACQSEKAFSFSAIETTIVKNVKALFTKAQQELISCTNSSNTQLDITNCSKAYSEKFITKLQQTYQTVQNKYKHEPIVLDRLEKSQKAWSEFVKAQVRLEYPDHPAYWGTSFSYSINILIAELYLDRILVLQRYLYKGMGYESR